MAQPRWIAKRPRIQAIPYAIACAILAGLVTGSVMGIPPTWVATTAFVFGVGTSIASIAVLAMGRFEAHQAGVGDRADLMLLTGSLSLLPALLALIAQWVSPTALPWHVGLLWAGVFPVVVGYAMVRRQLFEFRSLSKSSAAYALTCPTACIAPALPRKSRTAQRQS